MVVTISLALLESGNWRFGRPGFDYNSLRVRACVRVYAWSGVEIVLGENRSRKLGMAPN